MGRNFSNGERNRLINDMQRISLNYQTIISQQKSLYKDVKTDLQLLTLKGIADKLDAMSVDILADFKMGFRTKTLKDYNFNTYKDIYLTSVDELEKIRGISLDKAVQIKKIVLDVANEFKKEVKINLSIDNLDGSRFNLINSLYRYNTYSKYVDELLKVVNYRDTNEKIRLFAHNSSFFNYTFKAHEIKEKVNDTYNFLTSFRNKEGIAINNTFKTIQNFKTTRKEALADFEAHPISYINQLEALDPNLFGKDDKKFGLDEDLYNDVNAQVILEDGLKCTLRSYQTLGVKYILSQRRVLLGDEMGLGKTIEAIATMVSLRNSGMDHFIVVCPASVLINWQREINKHSDLKTLVVHGEDATANLNKWDIEGGVAITTYEATKYFEALNENTHVDMLIVDEAHYIKNPDALRTKNCIELTKLSNYILFMTGTALENKVEEMCNLIKILNPEVAKTLNSLVIMNAPLFKSKIATVYYRRKSEDVLTELPDLIESDEWCELTQTDKQKYEEDIRSKNYQAARQVAWIHNDLDNSSKAMRLMEIIDEAYNENRKVVIFSFFINTIESLQQYIGANVYGPINGSVSSLRRQEIIDEFEQAPAGSVLLAQIIAGGTGLNIQSANVVIICEPQFKPSIENQAIARSYRMGQTRNVLVYRLLCKDTIDEIIRERLYEKQNIFDQFADESDASSRDLELSTVQFNEIMEKEYQRITNQTNE